ncbi:MAG: SsrA-binding protein SmpB [Candidatus Omnitrophica bacterium]|nr:SsrA-binding protein SmpB [Candidatus Omnitrophota bacterium]
MIYRDIARYRKAFHYYHILDKYEAGIQLQGTEVKSLRAGKCNLKDSYAVVMEGELYLLNCHISMYEPAARMNHDPERRRKLLMRRKEIDLLFGKTQQKGLTLIPLRMYFKNGVAKVEIGLCKGKQLHDKRAALKDRELKRDAEAAMAKFK